MKYSINYTEFLDEVLNEPLSKINSSEKLKKSLIDERVSHDKDMKAQFDLDTKKWLSIMIGILFVTSHIVLATTLIYVSILEIYLIISENLVAAERFINSEVMMLLIGGTITQTAVSFIALTKYIFHPKEN